MASTCQLHFKRDAFQMQRKAIFVSSDLNFRVVLNWSWQAMSHSLSKLDLVDLELLKMYEVDWYIYIDTAPIPDGLAGSFKSWNTVQSAISLNWASHKALEVLSSCSAYNVSLKLLGEKMFCSSSRWLSKPLLTHSPFFAALLLQQRQFPAYSDTGQCFVERGTI